jgi:hypothetical protein
MNLKKEAYSAIATLSYSTKPTHNFTIGRMVSEAVMKSVYG